MRGNTIIDPYRVLEKKLSQANQQQPSLDINYFSLGQSSLKTEEKELDYV